MHVVIAGGSGFVGAYITQLLLAQQHQVTMLSHSDLHKVRTRLAKHYPYAQATPVFAPPTDFTLMSYEEYNGEGDILINLSGESLGAKPITTRRLQLLLSSRLKVLEMLSEQLALPPIFIQASAVAVYPNGTYSQDETSPTQGDNDIAKLALQVEARACALNEQFKFKNFYLARFGIVLHRDGGLIKKASLIPPFTVIHGNNQIPFIELNDAAMALLKLCEGEMPSGPVNLTSPHYANLKDLLHCCYKYSKIPQLPILTGLLRFGDRRVQLLRADQQIVPQALLDAGFKFAHADIDSID